MDNVSTSSKLPSFYFKNQVPTCRLVQFDTMGSVPVIESLNREGKGNLGRGRDMRIGFASNGIQLTTLENLRISDLSSSDFWVPLSRVSGPHCAHRD